MSGALLGVVGTDTEVGKTVVAAAVTAALRAEGHRVGAVKPVATGVEPGTPGDDALLLAAAAGAEPMSCLGIGLRLPRAPLAAARAEGSALDEDALVQLVLRRARAPELLVVEGVGGVLVPITERLTVAGLMRRLGARVVVVARPGLGTVNHTVLTVEACRDAGVGVLGAVLCHARPPRLGDAELAAENAALIEEQAGVGVLGTLGFVERAHDPAALGAAAAAGLDLATLWRAARSPASDRAEVVRLDRSHAWHPFTQTGEWLAEDPLVIERGEGCQIVDADGREYLDAVSSLWCNVHGHAHPRLDRALREQAGRLAHATFLGQTHEPGARLAAELAAVAPPGLDRVFFSESGASAVEAALRVALLAQRHRGQVARTRFLSLTEAYHGDTAGAVSVGRADPFHRGLEPLLFEALRTPPPHLLAVRERLDPAEAEARSLRRLGEVLDRHGGSLAAAVIEPRVQGATGMWVHSDAWLREAARLVRDAGALLVCDEVATGFGRTGDMFASAGAGVEPDLLAVGKGLGAGYLPISATLASEELFELFTAPPAEHRTLYYGHTYTANPLACAVARESLRLFAEEATLERGRRLAERLGAGLEPIARLAGVAQVRRRGVMAGIELCAGGLDQPHDPALRVGRQVVLAARRRGVVVRPLGDIVVVNPPLVMGAEQCDRVLAAVAESIEEITRRIESR